MTKKKRATKQPPAAPVLRSRIKELRFIRAADIEGAPWNWRTHGEDQKASLAGSIEELGFIDPLDVRELEDGRVQLFDGHARRNLIDERIGPDTLIPCSVTDLTEAEAKQVNLTKDPLAAMAGADKERLDALLAEVRTGEALEGLLARLREENGIVPAMPTPGAGGDEFDTTAALEGDCRVKAGELWLVDGGRHRVMCGDSTDAAVVARLMGGQKAAAVVTDPPYGVNVNYPSYKDTDKAYRSMLSFLLDFWLTKVTTGAIMLFGAGSTIARELKIFTPEPDRVLIWHVKFSLAPTAANGIYFRWHPIYCWRLPKQHEDGPKRDVIEECTEGHNNWDHPGTKPIKVMSPLIGIVPKEHIVFDSFLGSGTTVIAAHRLNRRCFGIEIEPKYVEVILRRCEAEGLTVEKAS